MKKVILLIIAVAVSGVMYSQYDSANRMNKSKDYSSTKSKNYSSSDSLKKHHPDGYVMKEGKVMKIKDGKFTTLDKDVTLSNGTVIMKNGSYMKNGETKMMLKEGEHIDLQGNVKNYKENWDTDKAKKDNKMDDQMNQNQNQNYNNEQREGSETDRSSIDRSGNQ